MIPVYQVSESPCRVAAPKTVAVDFSPRGARSRPVICVRRVATPDVDGGDCVEDPLANKFDPYAETD